MQKINKFFLRFSIPMKLTEFSLFNLRRINKSISAIVDKTELRYLQKHCTVNDQIAERRKRVLFFEASTYFIG